MNTRNFFGYILSGLVVLTTIMSLLAIWGIIQWQYIERYVGKTVQSLVVIVISGIAVYLIQQLLMKPEKSQQGQQMNP